MEFYPVSVFNAPTLFCNHHLADQITPGVHLLESKTKSLSSHAEWDLVHLETHGALIQQWYLQPWFLPKILLVLFEFIPVDPRANRATAIRRLCKRFSVLQYNDFAGIFFLVVVTGA